MEATIMKKIGAFEWQEVATCEDDIEAILYLNKHQKRGSVYTIVYNVETFLDSEEKKAHQQELEINEYEAIQEWYDRRG